MNKIKTLDKLKAYKALIVLFLLASFGAFGLLSGVLMVVIAGAMLLIGVYVTYEINKSIGYSDATTEGIYSRIMSAYTILSVALIVIGASVIFRALYIMRTD